MYFIVHNILTQPNKVDVILKKGKAENPADCTKHTLLKSQVKSTLKGIKHPTEESKTLS